MNAFPLLYNYRRCPYAMRARLALHVSQTAHQIIDVDLRNKPKSLLDHSPKGTVPVLITRDNAVIDESLDIMLWALKQNDPCHWLAMNAHEQALQSEALTQLERFIPTVYQTKYPERYAEAVHTKAQRDGYALLSSLRLQASSGLFHDRPLMADFAWLPFIRQWAQNEPLPPTLNAWLNRQLTSDLFQAVMHRLKA